MSKKILKLSLLVFLLLNLCRSEETPKEEQKKVDQPETPKEEQQKVDQPETPKEETKKDDAKSENTPNEEAGQGDYKARQEDSPNSTMKGPKLEYGELLIDSPDVYDINDTVFWEMRNKSESFMVMFYGPWCGHCHSFAPTYMRLANIMAEDKFPFKACSLNGMANQNILKEENITHFPTIKIYHLGHSIVYGGGRTENQIYDALKRIVYGSIRNLTTLEEVQKVLNISEFVYLCTVNPNEDKDEYNAYEELADKVGDNVYLSCFSEECRRKYKAKINYFRKFDEPHVILDKEPFNFTDLLEFDKIYKYPLGGEFNEFAAVDIFKKNRTSIIYFRDSNLTNCTEKDYVFANFQLKHRSEIISFCNDIKGNLLIESLANIYGIEPKDLPYALLIQPDEDMSNNFVFPTDDLNNIRIDKLDEFLQKYYKGELKKALKSVREPEKQTHNFTVVVGKTFKREVIDNDDNVFVYSVVGNDEKGRVFYGDAWMKSADMFVGMKGIKLCGIELIMNDVESIPVKETKFRLYLKGKKDKPIVYEPKVLDDGHADLYEVLNWVTDNCGLPRFPPKPKEEPKEDTNEKKETEAKLEGNKKEEENKNEEEIKKDTNDESKKEEKKADL